MSDTQAKGGVGNSFEVSVAAVQLTAVLCGSSSALMGDGVTLTSVRHQNPDFKVDDLTLTGVRVRGGERITMAAGIRHKPSITRSDAKFVKLLGTFLTDLVEHRDACRNDMHRFGLVVSNHKAEGARELSRLTEAARASSSPEQMNLGNDPLRVRYRYLEAAVDSAVDLWIPDTVQVDVGASGSAERTLLIWELLRSLRVGVVQVLDEMAEARTAAINELRNVAADPTDAEDLWHHLVSMALRGNPNGAAFDRATLLRIFSGRLKPELNDRSDVRDVYSRALETHRVVLALQAQNDVFARVAPAYVSSRVLQVLREWDDRNPWQGEVRTAIEAVTGACKRAGLKDSMYSGLNTVNRARSTNSATLARLRAVDGDVAGLATTFEVGRRERKVNGLRMQQSARDALTWLQDQADSPTYASTINLAGSLGSGRSRALREFMAGLPAGRGLALFPEPFGAEDLAQSVLRAAAAVLGTRFTSLDALAAWMSRHSRDSRLYIVVDDLDHHGPEVTASVSFVVDETSQFDNLRWMFAADSHRLDLVTTRKGSEVWRMNGYTGSETLSSAGDGWIDLDVWNRADQTGLKILAAAIADGGRRNAPSKVSTQDAPDVEAIADNPEKFPHEVAHLASPLQALVRLRANHGPVPLTDVNHPQFARMYWDAIAQNAAELRVNVDRLEVFLRGLTVALVEQREVLTLTGNWAAYHQEALWLSSIGLATTYYAPDKNPANPAVRVVEPRLDAMWAERIDTEIASRPVATPASPGKSASTRPRVEPQPKVSRKKRRQAHKAATPADRHRGRAAQQARGSSTAQETKRPSRTSIRDLWPLLADWIARALHGNQLSDSVLQMAIMRIASDPIGQTGGDGDSKKRAPTPAGDSTIARSWAQDREVPPSPLLEAALTDPDHLRVSAVRVVSREDYRPDSPRELFVALRVASRLADGPGARWRAVERLRTIKRIYPDAARSGLVIYANAAISSVVSDPVLTGPGDYASVCAELTEVDFAGSTKPVAEQVVAAGAALFPDVKGWTASVARINKILDETSISDRSVVESRRGPRRHDPDRDDWTSFYRAYSRLFCEHVLARNSHANFLELAKQGWYRFPAEKASHGVKARARTARQTLNTSYGRLYRAASDDSALRRDHLRSVQAVLHQDALSAEAASSGAPGADPLDRANVAFHLIKHTNSAVDPARYEFDSVYRASLEDIWEILEVLAQERARERAGSTTVADQSSGEQRNFAELVDEVQKALKATPR